MLRRRRYGAVIEAQLSLFEREHADVIDEVRRRLDDYNRADRSDAEELYGDYLDSIETGTEILAEMRDHYAASLGDPAGYVREFNRAVAKHLPPFALELENR